MAQARDKFIPQMEMEGGGGGFSSFFNNSAPVEPAYTPPAYTPPPEPAYQAPAYTPPEVPDYFAQQFAPDVFSPTPEPAYGGYGRDLDDRYYEQMFAKGGIVNLLRRHMRKYQ
jgi:hypothetical protein